MMFATNDATAKMLMALKENNGKEALANIALMWAELYGKLSAEELAESYSMGGIYLLTKLIMRINDMEEVSDEDRSNSRSYGRCSDFAEHGMQDIEER